MTPAPTAGGATGTRRVPPVYHITCPVPAALTWNQQTQPAWAWVGMGGGDWLGGGGKNVWGRALEFKGNWRVRSRLRESLGGYSQEDPMLLAPMHGFHYFLMSFS